MLEKNFNPGSFEKNFSFEMEASLRKPNAEPFMVLLPPPNVTGSLHMGHSLCYTIQDIIVRYKRLKGYDVLFQPGLDHAGIVTQLLVEKHLYASGVKKGSLTRESLLKEIWLYKDNSGNTILEQMKTLGISCDFSRLRFTMDEEGKKAVTRMFVKLFESNLLYRGRRMINWDPLIGSAISDLEVIEKEVDGTLWYIKYMFADSPGHITVATARPETVFGDAAVAVNPGDERYAHLIGKEVTVPLTNRKVRIIPDAYADPQKGTGAVKITPAHDFNDCEVGLRHKLPFIEILNSKGELNENVPELFRKTDRFEAREKVVQLLEKKGLLDGSEKIKQKIPFGDRSGVPLEPRITYQWFVDTEKLAGPAIKAVREGKIKFIPKHWENLYFEWLKNIRPWCISRQIWWGHRIPAWYGPDGQLFVAENQKEAATKAAGFYGRNNVELIQDEDVLDTWFSSGIWPYGVLGWPENTPELERFYSKMLIVTGFDIIFFWVARMVMMSLYCMKEVPFPEVYIHGLVRDEKGQKMSKSKGNVMNPMDLCEKYGADAVRYTLASLSSPGRDIKMTDQSVEVGRNFLTKFWNIVRFSQMHGCAYNKEFNPDRITDPFSKWIICRVKEMVIEIEKSMADYRIDEMTNHLYHCVWDSFCDWYAEFVKPILRQPSGFSPEEQRSASSEHILLKKDIRDTTAWAIVQFIKVLYPISPFIAKKLGGEMKVLEMSWPEVSNINADFGEAVKETEFLKNLISSVRSVKQYLRVSPGEKISVIPEIIDSYAGNLISKHEEILSEMAGILIEKDATRIAIGSSIPVVVKGVIIHMNFGDKIEADKEKIRLKNEILKLEKNRDQVNARLMNEDFLRNADEKVILEHKNRIEEIKEKIERINYVLQGLDIV
ncbi:MAG: valine--tRNA ligase [Holosporaceae bacterium]|jgi:valyl-tRNA synthetase|nr:valine--tRNA ligase [Holosporaceae bacterium]